MPSRRCEDFRTPAPAVSDMIARASINLEQLSASYILDASQFFDLERSLCWNKLTSLVLTSNLLLPEESPTEIGSMLQAAAAAVAAHRMPQLLSMDVWNGRKGVAAAFQYRAFAESRTTTITWKSTWEVDIQQPVIDSWGAVALEHGRRLMFVKERLDKAAIKSHGDAIDRLRLADQVIQNVSLRQIRMEQEVLEGMPSCN